MNTNSNRSLIIVYSYHHKNTQKVADAIAAVLGAEVKRPQEIAPEELNGYDCIGFGSGIDSGKHYQPMLELADALPACARQKAFIFSTSAIFSEKKKVSDHESLREKLLSKGFSIIDEFSCKGFNTNSFLKYFGGMNKGRPNEEDLQAAKEFGLNLKQHINK